MEKVTNKKYIDTSKEYILCAAVKRKTPRLGADKCFGERFSQYDWATKGDLSNDLYNIEIGFRHGDIYQRFQGELEIGAEGFYTSHGRFVDRYEGMEVAYLAGQVDYKKALDKSWHKEGVVNATDDKGNVINEYYWDKHDNQKYNILISEDLY